MTSVAPITEPAKASQQRALKALTELPPFSPVLDRLLASLSNESVSISRLSDIIETDTVIAGNVLKLVNSALYGRRGTVNSVRHAVSLLGINKLRNAVFAMSITRVWSHVRTAPGWSTARFNLHSVGCGLMCDILAQRAPVDYPEGAFAAGLFHDLGQLLIAVALHAEYEEIRELVASDYASLIGCEIEVIGASHADLSAEALEIWNLPRAIQNAVRFHHTPDKDPSESEGKIGLAQIICCADNYLEANGMCVEKNDSVPDPEFEPFAPLGIKLASADFLEEFKTELEVLSGVFQRN